MDQNQQPRGPKLLLSLPEASELGAQALWVDTRPGPDYRRGHVPGAIHFDNFAHANERTGGEELDHLAQLWLDMYAQAGIPLAGPVVFYDAGLENRAPRPAVMLRALGNADSHVLDGGIEAWDRAGRELQRTPRVLESALPAKASFDPAMVAGVDDVVAAMQRGAAVLVDVRDEPEYLGRRRLQWNPRLGRIPGAVPIAWTRLLRRSGSGPNNPLVGLRPRGEMEATVAAAGLSADQELIIYCQKSHRACNSYLAFKELGFKNVRVYVGSYREWSRRFDLAVEKAPSAPA